jgi:hypothetical protein
MKEISKSNFLSLGQTTGILNLPSSVVAKSTVRQGQ